MKIFYAGAQRTGKTTLAKCLSDETGIPFMDAMVSQFLNSLDTNAEKNLEGSFNNQIFVQRKLSTYLDEKFQCRNFICDRSLLDVWGYTYYIYDKNYHSLTIDERFALGDTMENLLDWQRDTMVGNNSIIFIVNPNENVAFVEDAKSGSKVSQKKVAENILGVAEHLKKYGIIEVIPDDCTSLEDRTKFCLDAIERRKFR